MKSDQLKQRVIDAKSKLPKGIVPIFLNKWPKYNTPKQVDKIRNVLYLKTISEPITKKLEHLAKILN